MLKEKYTVFIITFVQFLLFKRVIRNINILITCYSYFIYLFIGTVIILRTLFLTAQLLVYLNIRTETNRVKT